MGFESNRIILLKATSPKRSNTNNPCVIHHLYLNRQMHLLTQQLHYYLQRRIAGRAVNNNPGFNPKFRSTSINKEDIEQFPKLLHLESCYTYASGGDNHASVLRLYSAVTAKTALTVILKRSRIEYGHLVVELDGALVRTGIFPRCPPISNLRIAWSSLTG